MAWTDPSTLLFAVGEKPAAGKLNTLINTNLLDLHRRTTPYGARVAAIETTSSNSYTDLPSYGPTLSVPIGSTGLAIVTLYVNMSNDTLPWASFMGIEGSGATPFPPSDGYALAWPGTGQRAGNTIYYSGLNGGMNIFTAKYRVDGGSVGATGAFNDRIETVTPLGS